MTLISCLCLFCLALGLLLTSLLCRHHIRAALQDIRLALFGVRVRVPSSRRSQQGSRRHLARPSSLDRSVAAPTWPGPFSPARVVPRAGP